MSQFANLKTKENMTLDTDTIAGGRRGPLESGVYDAKINLAYLDKSQGGATALHITFETDQGDVRQTIWMTSGDAKGNKNTYTDKEGNEQYLPGFSMANSIALLTVGKEIADVIEETGADKTIKLWDFDAKAELPTEKFVIVGLLNESIKIGIRKQIVDKNQKNADGNYVPTGETREINELEKVFRDRDGMTVPEILAQADEAVFINTWKERFTGDTVDKSTKKAGVQTGLAGSAANSVEKPKTSLFAS